MDCTGFYTVLFCVLGGESKAKEMKQNSNKCASIFSNELSWLDKSKRKVDHPVGQMWIITKMLREKHWGLDNRYDTHNLHHRSPKLKN